jgi:hypothetical protein
MGSKERTWPYLMRELRLGWLAKKPSSTKSQVDGELVSLSKKKGQLSIRGFPSVIFGGVVLFFVEGIVSSWSSLPPRSRYCILIGVSHVVLGLGSGSSLRRV